MHVRFSTCIGMNVTVESTDEVVGHLYDVLIDPDSGKIEGFFVEIPHLLFSEGLYLSCMDIRRWGTAIYVRNIEDVCDASDHLRIAPLLNDRRTFLGQHIRTEGGKDIGVCKDIQFDTEHMRVEWIFPKKFFRWGIALPVSEIVEVQPTAIIVRAQEKLGKKRAKKQGLSVFEAMPDVTPGID